MFIFRLRFFFCSIWEGSGGVEGGWEIVWVVQGSFGGSLMLSFDILEVKLGFWFILGKEGGKSMEVIVKEEDGYESRSNFLVVDLFIFYLFQV